MNDRQQAAAFRMLVSLYQQAEIAQARIDALEAERVESAETDSRDRYVASHD